MIIRTEPMLDEEQPICAACARRGVMVEHYQLAQFDMGVPVLSRRFICFGCRNNLSSSAEALDFQVKEWIMEGVCEVDGREKFRVRKQRQIARRPYTRKVFASAAHRLLEEATKLDKQGASRRAVQLLLEHADDWMRDGRIEDCVALMTEARPEKMSTTMALGLLAAFSPVREDTAEPRQAFIEGLKNSLRRTRPTTWTR